MGSLALLEIEELYHNSDDKAPIECEFSLPLLDQITFDSLSLEFNGQKIDTKIMEKSKARENYEDQVSRGNGAMLLEEKEESNSICLKLGNLLPDQTCKIRLKLVQQILVKDSFS